jgi:four helix bundle protein
MEKAHKNLKVWNEAMQLAKMIYKTVSELPSDERYGLSIQMKRAAVSVPSNIAEGAARRGNKESIHFYIIARASLSELDTQLELCKNLRLLAPPATQSLSTQIEIVDSLLSGLIRYKNLEREK